MAPTTSPTTTEPAGSLIGSATIEATPPPETQAEAEAPKNPLTEFVPLAVADLELPTTIPSDDPAIAEFLEVVNDSKLPKETAQKFLAQHEKLLTAAADTFAETWERTQDDWKTQVRNLPEFGGTALPATMSGIAKLLDRYGDAETRKAFDMTGAGNHPAVVAFLGKMAKHMNEAPPVSGKPASGVPLSRAERMYSNPTEGKT
jgi:hypothetical protein